MLMEDDFLITSATFSRFYEFATVPFLGQTLYNRSFSIVFNSPRGYSPRISENISPRLIYDEEREKRVRVGIRKLESGRSEGNKR